jgi:hypothetical protein
MLRSPIFSFRIDREVIAKAKKARSAIVKIRRGKIVERSAIICNASGVHEY